MVARLLLFLCLLAPARAELIEVFFYTQPSGATVYLHPPGGEPLLVGKSGESVRLPAELLRRETVELSFELPGRQRVVENVPVVPLLEGRRWPLVGSLRLAARESGTITVRFLTSPEGATIQAFNSAREPAYLGLSGGRVTLDQSWLKRGSAIEVNFSCPGYETWSETIPSGRLRDGGTWPPPGKQVALVPTTWTRLRQAVLYLALVPLVGVLLMRLRGHLPAAPAVPASLPEPGPLQVPGYTILEPLGQGGMADVFSARSASGEILALKLLHENEPEALQRLRREIKLWRELVHPNVVPLYDYGEVNGRYYLVMERVQGRTLRDLLQDDTLPVAEGLRILDGLLEGMAYAHARGIVHRDLKPENVMVREDGRVLILDFGLSRSVDNTTRITLGDKVMGTPAYIAPERLSGEAGPASDQYALGIIAYELLAGRHPLNDLEDLAVVLTQHLFERPQSLREVRPEVPAELDEAVMRMLEKQPQRRFASVSDARTVIRVCAASLRSR